MLLQVDKLRVAYDDIEVLHEITFQVQEGQAIAFVGANGAGKSSLLNALARIAPPHGPRIISGAIQLNDVSLLSVPTHTIVRRYQMALVPEGRHIFGNLTVAQNLKLATYGQKDKRQIESELDFVYGLFPRLAERRHQRSELMSGGEQQMLAIGRALMTGCKILLLDEPSMGLAPLLVQELFEKLTLLRRQKNLTIVLVEQNATIALKFADRVYVLETGEIVYQGTPTELQGNTKIRQAYLGM